MKKTIKIIVILTALVLISCKSDIYKEYYSNGTLKEIHYRRNGKFVGDYKAYYEDGTIHTTGQFKNGIMSGTWYYYYPDGKIQTIQTLKNGRTISSDFWDNKGIQVVKNGTGVAKHYYDNGQISSIMSYKNNILDGKCETWFEDGVKEMEFFYNNGRPVGIWHYWDMDGELIKTENYE